MRFSVVIPSYHSRNTILKCITGLKNQTFSDFEVICVDSSEDDFVKKTVEENSKFTMIHLKEKRSAEKARNIAVNKSEGEILVFLDPDCIPNKNWLAALDAEFNKGSRAVTGPVNCYGKKFIHITAHLAKFWLWLPDKNKSYVETAPTANFAVYRKDYYKAGGIEDSYTTSADTLLCYNLTANGIRIRFLNDAYVEHIHETNFKRLFIERFQRGSGFGLMRTRFPTWKKGYSVIFLLVVPLLPFKNVFLKYLKAIIAGEGRYYLLGFPLHIALEHAWMYGQCVSHLKHLIKKNNSSAT